MIDPSSLEKAGAKKIHFKKGEWIFRQGDHALNYFQVVQGQVKMSNFSEQGQEFVQGMFTEGQSFGEPPLFVDVTYPASALATTDCEVLKLGKDKFIELLLDNPKMNLEVSKNLAKRLHYKAVMATEISSYDPEHRILTLLKYLKAEMNIDPDSLFAIALTRQQIADMTGLRVETAIRAIKKMEADNLLQIKNRKIYL
ncbi:MAG: Crp/Fnr family transcriptional regulator [Reichenbachiella sp.]|uniref:Crp/Fnr family transcriptional regulator n=1 Tax=Reichenbachiella sp. TaxID=2184521 RepID=UPI0032994249